MDKLTHSNRHIKHKHLNLREETHTLKKQNRLLITLLVEGIKPVMERNRILISLAIITGVHVHIVPVPFRSVPVLYLSITLLVACLLHIHQVKASTPDTCVNHNRVFPLKEVMQNGGSSLLSHILVDTNCRKVGARLEEKEKDALCFHHTHLYQV